MSISSILLDVKQSFQTFIFIPSTQLNFQKIIQSLKNTCSQLY